MATTLEILRIVGNRALGESDRVEPSAYEDTESIAIDARVSVYPLGENHPLAVVFGAFDNEPLWDDWMAAINEYRQQEDERELQADAGE
jgi:hypothetical protein